MNIREISKPVTAASLNESLAQKFGQKIKLEKFTLEQLQDARNKLRTKLFQVETNESFDAVNTESYQKSKLFLDVLNAAISERSDVDSDEAVAEGDGIYHDCAKSFKHPKLGECTVIPGQHTLLEDGTVTHYDVKFEQKGKRYIARNVAISEAFDIVSEGHMHASKKKKKKNESIVKEGAEDAAELVMAAKDMVDRLTGWMEDTAEMQTESMLELADAIRDEMGSEKSEAFTMSVKPALEALYAAMETTRVALTGGVGLITGENAPATDMGAPDDMDMELPVDAELGNEVGAELPPQDEFAAAPPAAGGEEEAGRAKRESVIHKTRAVVEQSRKIASILSKKK